MMTRQIILLGKGLVTVSLVIVLSVIIAQEYRAAQPILKSIVTHQSRWVDPDKVQLRARTATLNNYMPAAYEPLVEFIESHGQKNNGQIRSQYVEYYEKVVEFVPDQADAYALLGFCYYYLGETQKAVSAYQRAMFLNPRFFWSAYSLGVIYFKSKEYVSALAAFKSALAASPETTLATLRYSQVYRPLIRIVEPQLPMRLQNGYQNIYIFLRLIQENNKKSLGEENIGLEVF